MKDGSFAALMQMERELLITSFDVGFCLYFVLYLKLFLCLQANGAVPRHTARDKTSARTLLVAKQTPLVLRGTKSAAPHGVFL